MKNKKTVIILIVLAVVVIGVYLLYSRAKRQNAEGKAFVDFVHGAATIPAAVLAEPVKDWEGQTLNYQGSKYTPVNGVWVKVS